MNPALNPLNTNSHYDLIVTSTKSQPDYNKNYLIETEISDKLKHYNAKHPGETFSLEMDLFAFVVMRKVPQLPHNCDGVCKFEISYPFHLWKAKVKDGCYWHTLVRMTTTGWNKKALQMSWITCMYQQEMPNISNTSHTKQTQFQTHKRCNLQV